MKRFLSWVTNLLVALGKFVGVILNASPRHWSLRTRWLIAGGVAVKLLLGLYLNYKVQPGGILEDPITDPNNALVQENKRGGAPFCGNDYVAFFLDRRGLTDEETFTQYREMHWQLYNKLPWARDGLLSLVTLPYLKVMEGENGKELRLDPYMGEGLSTSEVRSNLLNDDMERILYSRDRSRLGIMIILPKGYNQSDLYFRYAEIIEEREISWFERRFWKYHLYPTEKYQHWKPVGWPLAREAIERGLPAQTLLLCGLGVVIGATIIWWSTGNFWFALYSLSFTALGLMWVRGSIFLFGQFMLFRERPYIIMADENTLIQGLSYFLLCSFIMRAEDKEERLILVGAGVFNLIMGQFNQLSLWWSFDVRTIKELALMSGVGLLDTYFLSQAVLPILLQKIPRKEEREQGRIIQWIQRQMMTLAKWQNIRFSLTVLCLIVVAGGIALFYVPLGSQPLDFIIGHTLHDSFTDLQDDSQGEGRRMAADGIPMRVASTKDANIYEPAFWENVDGFTAKLEADPGTVAVGGIHRTFFRLMTELYGHRLPQSQEKVEDVMANIDLGLRGLPCVQRSLYTDHELQLTLLQKKTNTSLENVAAMTAIAKAAAKFQSLAVDRTGESALYGETDRMIWVGKLWNIGSQVYQNQVGYWVGVVVLVAWYSRQHKARARVSAFRLSLVLSVPFLFATAVMTIVMAVGRIHLDQANAAVLASANSASSDFIVYFGAFFIMVLLRTGRIAEALKETFRLKGDQVTEDVVINAVCFMTLLASRYLTIQQMGWMIPLMLALCAFGVLVIMPPLLPWTVKWVDGQEPKGQS